MTNSKYNVHTDPIFKSLKLLKIKDIYDLQCMKIWYKFVKNNVPTYFASVFRYNHELYNIQTRSKELLHLYPVRTYNACNALRHRIPELFKDLSMMYRASCTDWSSWPLRASDLTMHDTSCLNPIMTWIIWFWYIAKPKFASEIPKREEANHAL